MKAWITALIPLMLLAGCARPNLTAPSSGATLNLVTVFPTTLDPIQGGNGNSSMFLQSIFSGLVRYDTTSHLVPDLAQSWQVSDDRTVYTFSLRKDARFHNGDPVTAAAIVYAINRACDPAAPSPVAADYLGTIQGVTERLANKASTVSGVSAVDDQTVRFQLTHPDDAFLAKLTFPLAFALDQRTVDAGGRDWWQQPNGSGPFRLSSWQPGNVIVLERATGYYGPAPNVGQVVLHAPPQNISDLGTDFANGSLDMVPLPPTPQQIGPFLDSTVNVPDNVRSALHVYDEPSLQYLIFNTKEPPFDNLAVRQAVNLAIQREALVTAVLGGDGWPANGILPPGIPGFDRSFNPYPYNPTLARATVARSPSGQSLPPITLASPDVLSNGQPGPMTQAVATMLQQTLGFQVKVTPLPDQQINTMLARGTPPGNITIAGWQADYLDPQDFLGLLFHTGSGQNLAHYSNQAVDKLLDQAEQTPDAGQRTALYQAAQATIMRDAPIVPLYFNREFVLLNPRVTSLPLLPDGSFDLRDARVTP